MVDEKLLSFIKEAKQKGYSKEEITKLLLEKKWTQEEIEEAFNPPKERIVEYKPAIKKADYRLTSFIKEALNKHYSTDEIRKALLSKGWAPYDIDLAFNEVKPKIESYPSTEIKPKFIEPTFEYKKPKKEIAFTTKIKKEKFIPRENITRKIIVYFLAFIIISSILSFTFLVFYYMKGVTSYTIKDPNTGNQITGACLQENCSDMKGFALNFAKEKLMFSILVSCGITLAIIFLHEIIPYKNLFLWLVNLAYLGFLTMISYMWIVFNQTK